jgi:hypothetical protein
LKHVLLVHFARLIVRRVGVDPRDAVVLVDPLRGEVLLHERPRRLRADQVAAHGVVLRVEGLDEGVADGDVLEPVEQRAHVQDGDGADADAALDRELDALDALLRLRHDELRLVQRLLDRNAALHGAPRARHEVVVIGPQHDNSVASVLEDVAAVRGNDARHHLEVRVQVLCEVLRPAHTVHHRHRLAQLREARDVREEAHRVVVLDARQVPLDGRICVARAGMKGEAHCRHRIAGISERGAGTRARAPRARQARRRTGRMATRQAPAAVRRTLVTRIQEVRDDQRRNV